MFFIFGLQLMHCYPTPLRFLSFPFNTKQKMKFFTAFFNFFVFIFVALVVCKGTPTNFFLFLKLNFITFFRSICQHRFLDWRENDQTRDRGEQIERDRACFYSTCRLYLPSTSRPKIAPGTLAYSKLLLLPLAGHQPGPRRNLLPRGRRRGGSLWPVSTGVHSLHLANHLHGHFEPWNTPWSTTATSTQHLTELLDGKGEPSVDDVRSSPEQLKVERPYLPVDHRWGATEKCGHQGMATGVKFTCLVET